MLSASVLNLASPNSFTSLASIVRHCFLLEFDILKCKRLIHKSLHGRSLHRLRKNLKYVCLCKNHFPVLSCRVKCIKNIHRRQSDTVKKFANISDLSTRPETSSKTIRRSSSIFYPKLFSLQLIFFFCTCSNKSSNSLIVCTYLKSTF